MEEPRVAPRFPRLPVGVPRFELGTSPTRTERATRLRHTPSPYRLAAQATMHDRCALVLDVIEARLGCYSARLRRDEAELKPERARAHGDGLAGYVRTGVEAAEHVDEADRLLDLGHGRGARHAQPLLA